MTPADLILFMVVFALLYLVKETWTAENRCAYCGEVNSHDAHCPYQGTEL